MTHVLVSPSPKQLPRATSKGVVRALPFEGDDAALVRGMREGRLDAASAFYDRHADAVHRLVFRLLGPDGELEDVVHDVFVRALESIERLRDPGALRAFVFGIAVMVVRIKIQRRSRQRWLRFMAPEEVPEVAVTSDVGLGEAVNEVYGVLASLPVDERIAFVLHRVEGLSLEEAAHAADTSFSTFRRRLARGEAKFFARAKHRPALESWIEEDAR